MQEVVGACCSCRDVLGVISMMIVLVQKRSGGACTEVADGTGASKIRAMDGASIRLV